MKIEEIKKEMENIFIELQNAISEGSDLDLPNEDCHILSEYIDSMHNLLTEMCESFKEVFEWVDNRSYSTPFLDYDKLRKNLNEAKQYLQDTKENS